MSLIDIAAQLFKDKLGSEGSNLDLNSIVSSLQGLLPTNNGELDIQGLIGQFTGEGGGLAALASSWLGDGANANFSVAETLNLFGEGRVADFASQLGLNTDTAASGLSDMIPDLVDKASSGGELQTQLLGAAGKLFGKFF